MQFRLARAISILGVRRTAPRHHPGTATRGIPSLDGWRAISILLVLCLHTMQDHAVDAGTPARSALLYALANGSLGVRIFFVLSGYLITRLLLREHAQTGRISLRRFYARRFFRILPPFYAYLGFVAMLVCLHRIALPTQYLLMSALFLTANVTIPSSVPFWPLEHIWSLCVEEQFYLLWPALLVWAFAAQTPARRQARATSVALAAIILMPVLRIVWSMPPFGPWHSAGNTLLQLDTISFGVFGAVAEGHATFERAYRALARHPLLLACLLYLVSGWIEIMYPGKYMKSIGTTLNGVLILALLLWTVRNPQTWVGRFLNARPVAWTGVLSYSLYLWQTFFLHRENTSALGRHTPLPVLVSWGAIVLCAVLSFRVIERPSLAVRDRFLRGTPPA